MSTLKRDELSIIFQYLNDVDLHDASRVCRFWLEIAKEEKYRRKPTWMNKTGLKFLQNFQTFKTEFIDYCQIKPSLHLMFYNSEFPKEILEGCYCQYKPYIYSTITVKSLCTRITKNDISNTFFPEMPNIKITTITLNYTCRRTEGVLRSFEGVFCEELKCFYDISFRKARELKTIFEPFTGNDIPMSSCVVFIYNYRKSEVTENLVFRLKEWFPTKKMSILAIATDNISFCNNNYSSRVCRFNADCIAILLNGTNMESWTHEFKFISSTEIEMTEFKKKVSLKKHSVCFMGSSVNCFQYYFYQYERLFPDLFPNVPLFNINCIGSVASNEIEEICNSIDTFEENQNTGFLLLTHD